MEMGSFYDCTIVHSNLIFSGICKAYTLQVLFKRPFEPGILVVHVKSYHYVRSRRYASKCCFHGRLCFIVSSF